MPDVTLYKEEIIHSMGRRGKRLWLTQQWVLSQAARQMKQLFRIYEAITTINEIEKVEKYATKRNVLL